jgi:hypothetical protein
VTCMFLRGEPSRKKEIIAKRIRGSKIAASRLKSGELM